MSEGLERTGGWAERASPWIFSAALLILLAVLCQFTALGRNYPAFLRTSRRVWADWRPMTPEQRRIRAFDSTYPAVLYLRDTTPPGAVVLLPPKQFILEHTQEEIPILSSASAVYNLAYPRVPVHWGDSSPWRDKISYLLVWEHWGLSLADSSAVPTEDNRIQIYRWGPGRKVLW